MIILVPFYIIYTIGVSFDNILDLKQYSVIQICILCLAFVFYCEHLKLNSVSQFRVQNNMLEGFEKTPNILLTLHRMAVCYCVAQPGEII